MIVMEVFMTHHKMMFPNETLDHLAQDFLTAWQNAHGFSAGSARSLIGPERLAILIEGAFSKAERKLAEAQSGETLLREFASELLNQICAAMLEKIERVAERKVLSSDINVNPDADQVMFIFKLEEKEHSSLKETRS
jgi:uncharacterized protein YbcI